MPTTLTTQFSVLSPVSLSTDCTDRTGRADFADRTDCTDCTIHSPQSSGLSPQVSVLTPTPWTAPTKLTTQFPALSPRSSVLRPQSSVLSSQPSLTARTTLTSLTPLALATTFWYSLPSVGTRCHALARAAMRWHSLLYVGTRCYALALTAMRGHSRTTLTLGLVQALPHGLQPDRRCYQVWPVTSPRPDPSLPPSLAHNCGQA